MLNFQRFLCGFTLLVFTLINVSVGLHNHHRPPPPAPPQNRPPPPPNRPPPPPPSRPQPPPRQQQPPPPPPHFRQPPPPQHRQPPPQRPPPNTPGTTTQTTTTTSTTTTTPAPEIELEDIITVANTTTTSSPTTARSYNHQYGAYPYYPYHDYYGYYQGQAPQPNSQPYGQNPYYNQAHGYYYGNYTGQSSVVGQGQNNPPYNFATAAPLQPSPYPYYPNPQQNGPYSATPQPPQVHDPYMPPQTFQNSYQPAPVANSHAGHHLTPAPAANFHAGHNPTPAPVANFHGGHNLTPAPAPYYPPGQGTNFQQPAQNVFRPQQQVSIQQQPIAAPNQQQQMVAPLQQQPLSAPIQQQPMALPIQQQPMAAPMQQQAMATPIQQQPMAAPIQQQPMAAPIQQQPMAAPIQQQPMAAPIQQQPISSPMQHGSHSSHQQHMAAQAVGSFNQPTGVAVGNGRQQQQQQFTYQSSQQTMQSSGVRSPASSSRIIDQVQPANARPQYQVQSQNRQMTAKTNLQNVFSASKPKITKTVETVYVQTLDGTKPQIPKVESLYQKATDNRRPVLQIATDRFTAGSDKKPPGDILYIKPAKKNEPPTTKAEYNYLKGSEQKRRIPLENQLLDIKQQTLLSLLQKEKEMSAGRGNLYLKALLANKKKESKNKQCPLYKFSIEKERVEIHTEPGRCKIVIKMTKTGKPKVAYLARN